MFTEIVPALGSMNKTRSTKSKSTRSKTTRTRKTFKTHG
jgi:hypothetical protein